MKIPQALRDELSAAGKKGGAARAKKLTKAERRAIAVKGGKARWAQRLKEHA